MSNQTKVMLNNVTSSIIIEVEIKATKLEKMMELMMNKMQVHCTEEEDSGKENSTSSGSDASD